MIQQKVVFQIILLLVLCVGPAWAQDGQVDKAIEMRNNGSSVPAANEKLTSQPIEKIKKDVSAPSSTVKVATVPSDVSWWDGLAEMVGLSNSDPGLTTEPTPSQKALPTTDYVIGPGDVIGISVWKDDSLTRTVVVLPDGKITFPLLGDLVAGGKTVAQLKQDLESGLIRYVADSSVTVEVKQSNSMIIYIIGRVNAPGRQVLVANTNVLQALAMAGGVNPFASKSKVKIFRQEVDKTAMFLFDYGEVAEGRHLEMNIELKRGDVIIVP
jgi:polysaccharide export outer membrane protein